ncbi:MAG: PilZ domain-containing protein [Treponema sp.]|nr:PilZ domain-containing protein [Treponema sp.]
MAILPKQKIVEFYERFKAIDVTYSKEIIQVSGLVTNQVYLKCVGDFWPCVIYTSSFEGAKIIVSIKSGILQKLERANNIVSLRFCFKRAEKGNPVAFFVNTKSVGYSPYGNSEEMGLFNLQFTQRPPDDLIEILGRILDANVNSAKRREERIIINPDTMRKLNIISKDTVVFLQSVPRNCILRDISFSGAKVIMMGVAKFLEGKETMLKIDFDDPKETFFIKGKFLRAEQVEGRKDLVAMVILFEEGAVPMGYKIRLNEFISQIRADSRGTENTVKE